MSIFTPKLQVKICHVKKLRECHENMESLHIYKDEASFLFLFFTYELKMDSKNLPHFDKGL